MSLWGRIRLARRYLVQILLVVVLGVMVLGVGACTTATPAPSPSAPGSPSPTAAPSAELQVAVAANLSTAWPEISRAFQQKTGIHVVPIISSSGKLAQQVANGAPYDVFLSADEQYIDDLAARGLIDPASKRIYAFGRLALVVNRHLSVHILNVASLAAPSVRRIAIANPDVAPYGRAARQALQQAGIWPLVQERLVVGESVRHALQFVQSDNADAGLVAFSIAHVPEVEVYPVREDLYAPIAQAAGIVTRTRQRAAAEQFLTFLTGPEGRRILEKYGYLFLEGEQ